LWKGALGRRHKRGRHGVRTAASGMQLGRDACVRALALSRGFLTAVLTRHYLVQHVKVNMMACESPDCTHRFCTYCLAVHLSVDTDSSAGKGWKCPTCTAGCCCSQPECNKAHRHCKAFRYRCRRAAAASLRMSAAHALVSLGVSPAKGKGKTGQFPQAMQAAAQHAVPASALPAKRRDSCSRAGSFDGMETQGKMARIGATGDDQEQVISTAAFKEQMESEAGETAASVLASISMGLRAARSPSPAAEQDDGMSPDAEPRTDDEEDGVEASNEDAAPPSTGRLEQLAMFALQSLAAMEPARDRSPSQPDNALVREVSEESSASTLATPRTVVNVARGERSHSKMAIDQLTATTPTSVPSSPTPCDVNM